MRSIVFARGFEYAINALKWLLTEGEDVAAVVCRPGGEIGTLLETASQHHVPTYQAPPNPNEPEFIEFLRAFGADLFIFQYFGRLVTPEFIAIPPLGCINMHTALLPKYRGQSAQAWMIANGDEESGMTIHYIAEGIDTGDIIAQVTVPIEPTDTGVSMERKVATQGLELFKETYPLLKSGKAPRISQNHEEATWCVAPRSYHFRIDWNTPAIRVHNHIRGFHYPAEGGFFRSQIAFTSLGRQRLLVYSSQVVEDPLPFRGEVPGQVLAVTGEGILVNTGDGQILLTDVRLPGAEEMGEANVYDLLDHLPFPCVLGNART